VIDPTNDLESEEYLDNAYMTRLTTIEETYNKIKLCRALVIQSYKPKQSKQDKKEEKFINLFMSRKKISLGGF